VICEDLTFAEVALMVCQMEKDREQKVDMLLSEHADQFEEAWFEEPFDNLVSMKRCMNNLLLPYRLHLIPLLIGWRLFGQPPQ
jgi:hypothetical protein